MTEIWIDNAPGEYRAAMVEGGRIVEVYLQRTLNLSLGETGAGRIDRKTASGSYIVTGTDSEILVRGHTGKPEGARVAFEIIREAICEPGRAKPAEAKLVHDVPPRQTSAGELWNMRLDAQGELIRRNADISTAFDAAIAGMSSLGDVIVHFQRTKAGLVFDVDGIGDAIDINMIAASEIARLLRLYQVGGMALIDFVSVESKGARQKIAQAFDDMAMADHRPFERTAINGYGLMQVVRARPRPSVLDQLFGTRIAALSTETQAYWLLREAARSAGYGQRLITAAVDVANVLASSQWASLRTECERQMGASLAIVADNDITGYGHVHVAQS